MAQFAVHVNPDPRTRAAVPYLLDVQSDLLSTLETRLVVPLCRLEGARSMTLTRLTPVVQFEDHALVAMVPRLAGIARSDLGVQAGDLAEARGPLIQAVDLLLTGF
jgi:toxin CcdB